MRILTLLLVFLSLPVLAQPTFDRGEVIVSSATLNENGFDFDSTITVFHNDGTLERTLLAMPGRLLTDIFAREGIVYIGARAPNRIERVTASGTLLPPFATSVVNVNYLSPGPQDGLLAMNVSGEIYQFASDGTLLRYRDVTFEPNGTGGLDLASDQCTVLYATGGSLVQWNACSNAPATFLTPDLPDTTIQAVRILPDGSVLLTAVRGGGTVLHVSRTGTIIREYPTSGAYALALDPDGTSFWTNAANYLLHIDIATGAVLSETYTDKLIFGITTIGEPRAGINAPAAAAAPIPALSPLALILLAMSLTLVALPVVRR